MLESTVTAEHLIKSKDIDTVNPEGLLQPLEAIFPEEILKPRKNLTITEFINQLCEEHDYINLFTLESIQCPRVARFMCFYCGFMVAVLWETVFCMVLFPQGKCEILLTKKECKALMSTIAAGTPQVLTTHSPTHSLTH